MKPIEKILLYTAVLLSLLSGAYMLKQATDNDQVVYLNIGKLLGEYQLKKDLETEGNGNLYRIKAVVDSLKMIQHTAATAVLDSQVNHAEQAFDQYYNYYNQELSKKVWERLNPELERFGKEKHFRLLIGANGAGTVMYGDTRADITDEAIKYVNAHYTKGS